MGLTNEIRDLKALLDNDTITSAEFARAKAALLAEREPTGRSPSRHVRPHVPPSGAGTLVRVLQILAVVLIVSLGTWVLVVFSLSHVKS